MLSETQSAVAKVQRASWLALSTEARAWELAKVALGPNASSAALFNRTREIMEAI